MTGLQATVVVTRPGFSLDIALDIDAGETVAILGPNGSGKSTLLRALAGLQDMDGGSVIVDDRVLDGRGVRVPPEQRGIGMVHQDYLLFPHLSAVDNIAFGLRSRGMGRSRARATALAMLEDFGLTDYADARPGSLSGGQAQRVALGRALVTAPPLLLLDEPLSALDAGTRASVRADLRQRLSAFSGCAIVVTHDPLDALALADRIVILESGRIAQSGTPTDVVSRPATEYVAALVGVVLMRGHASDGRVSLAGGGALTVADQAISGPALIAIRPESVSVHRTAPEGSARNAWEGTVASLVPHGDRVRVAVDGTPSISADITPASVAALGIEPGQRVWLSVKATEIDAYPDALPAG